MNKGNSLFIGIIGLVIWLSTACSIDLDTLLPAAEFTISNNACVAPCTIEASNASERFDSFLWAYDEETSSEASLSFSPTTTTRFALQLTASSATAGTSITKSIYATFADPAQTASYSFGGSNLAFTTVAGGPYLTTDARYALSESGSEGVLNLPALDASTDRYAARINFPIATPITSNLRVKFKLSDTDKFADFGGKSDSLAIAGLYLSGGLAADGTSNWNDVDSLGGYWCGLIRNTSGNLRAVIRTSASIVFLEVEEASSFDFLVEYTNEGNLRMAVSHDGTDSNSELPVAERLLGTADVSVGVNGMNDIAVRELFFSWLDQGANAGELTISDVIVQHQ